MVAIIHRQLERPQPTGRQLLVGFQDCMNHLDRADSLIHMVGLKADSKDQLAGVVCNHLEQTKAGIEASKKVSAVEMGYTNRWDMAEVGVGVVADPMDHQLQVEDRMAGVVFEASILVDVAETVADSKGHLRTQMDS
jgi:hypothetical protein